MACVSSKAVAEMLHHGFSCRMMQSDENETHAEHEMGLGMELKLGFFLLQSLTLPRPEVADNLLTASVFAHLCCMFVSITSSCSIIL